VFAPPAPEKSPAPAKVAAAPAKPAPAAAPPPAAKVAAAPAAPSPPTPAPAASMPAEPAPKSPVAAESSVDVSAEDRHVFVPGSVPAPLPPAPAAPAESDSLVVRTPQQPAPAAAASNNLFVPRQPTQRDEEEPQVAEVVEPPASTAAPLEATRIEAREANEIATVHEEQPKRSHLALWIVAGAVVVGGAAIAGVVLYENSRTASNSTISLSWSH